MAEFTVRIELHKAAWSDYETLHAAMEQRGFTRVIKSDQGKMYRLPWAEYYGFGDLTSQQVRDSARAAANSTGKSNAVLVTEGPVRTWVGLEEVSV